MSSFLQVFKSEHEEENLRKGMIEHYALSKVWPNYPTAIQAYLLNLMYKYEVRHCEKSLP